MTRKSDIKVKSAITRSTELILRQLLNLQLLFFCSIIVGELLLISRDAPNLAYAWRRFSRVAYAHDFWLDWVLIGIAGLALARPAMSWLLSWSKPVRIVGTLTIFYLVALLFQLARVSVVWTIGVEPGYDLVAYAMARAGNIASDGMRELMRVSVWVPITTIIFASIGFLLHRRAKKSIGLIFDQKLSEDQQDPLVAINRPGKWPQKLVPIVIGAASLLLAMNMPELRDLVTAVEPTRVGTPTGLPLEGEVRMDLHSYRGTYRERYGYNLEKGTNIVIYMMESVRDEYVELERSRHFRKTSEVRRAKRFYVPIPHSSNSHYSLLTGNYSSRKALWKYGDLKRETTMPGILAAAGYRSYYITSGPAWYDDEDKMLRRMGMRIMQRKDLDSEKNPRTGRRYRRFGWGINDISMLDGLRRILKKERGPFLMVHVFSNTHTPYWNPYPGKYRRHTTRTKVGRHRNGIDWTLDLIDRMTDEYKKHGLYKKTIFILLSDHGESFGEHGFRMHDFSLYNTEVRVPFIVRHPDLRRVDDIKEFPAGTILDVYPTVLDMLGLPYQEPVHGRSLFAPDYRLRLLLRSWGSDAYSGFLLDESKWIYGRRRRRLLRMNLDDGDVRGVPLDKAGRRFIRTLRELSF